MTTVYPASEDSFDRPTASSSLSGHAALHDDLADAIEAIENKVGVDNSTDTTSIDYKLAHLGDTYYTETEVDNALAAKLDSSDYTANDVLTKIKTVDGAGSGLDADTLDGNQASAFSLAHSHPYAASDHNHNTVYLGINAKAADADLLDGISSGSFLRSDATDTATGKITFTNNNLGSDWSNCQVIVAPQGDAGIAIRTADTDAYTVQLRAGGGSNGNRLYVTGDKGGGTDVYYSNITCKSVTETSALRFKEEVQPVFAPVDRDAIDLVKKINTSSFVWKNDTTNTRVVGVIADELVDVFPEAVQYDQDGLVSGIETQRMVYATLGALRQAIEKIETLEAKVAELEGR